MANCPQYLEALFGIWHAGLIAVPMNSRLHPREIAYILDSASARACLVGRDTRDGVAPLEAELPALKRVVDVGESGYEKLIGQADTALSELDEDEPAWLFYTSGTTGRPKGAILTHRNLALMSISHHADIDSLRPTDTVVNAAPLSHGCGLWAIPSIARGANNVVLECPSYDAAHVCEVLAHWPRVRMYHAPTMVKRLVDYAASTGASTEQLDTLIYGGSHMYLADLRRALDVLGPKLVQIYGQGECPNTITFLDKETHADASHPRYEDRLSSAGTARSGVTFRIADPEGQTVPANELGEVLVRSDIVMRGYWNNPEASAQSLRDGWLHTGDIGCVDAEGFLTIKDRSKDMIISGR